ncbi:MAG: hypothetical protein CME58_09195 [Halieaceae bacterium]|nr:hypothetical protein [Halieaceae bacterium]|tara:strand:- start:2368 stop:2706 length:339 start_codon:yes stop_codon:yes gene_type:complete
MLTTQSYLIAMLIYWAAALAGLVLIRRSWFPAKLSRSAGLVLGCIGGVLLTPAFPGPEVATLAPALIVVIFNALFGGGTETALTPGLWLISGLAAGGLCGAWWVGRNNKTSV